MPRRTKGFQGKIEGGEKPTNGLARDLITGNLFSMMALDALLQDARITRGFEQRSPQSLPTGWPELDRVLPDGGFAIGVTELSAQGRFGGSTSLALALFRSALTAKPGAWVAWVESKGESLQASTVDAAGVSREQLLVVRADEKDVVRSALKVVESGMFSAVAIRGGRFDERSVRKLALFAEESSCRILLFTTVRDAHAAWPTVQRLELYRTVEDIHVRVAKDRRGRAGGRLRVPLRTRFGSSEEVIVPFRRTA